VSAEDLTGRRFGRLVTMERKPRWSWGHAGYLCRCDCGKELIVLAGDLSRGHTTSCGCWRRDGLSKDFTGERFGRLVALKRFPRGYSMPAGGIDTGYLCLCDCGKEFMARSGSLQSGQTLSCGCLTGEKISQRLRKRPYEHLWNVIVKRHRKRWDDDPLSYEDFVKFTSEPLCHYCGLKVTWPEHSSSDKGYNLDRIDNSQGYVTGNCVVCCSRCNRGKGDMFTYEEWKKIGEVIKTFPKPEVA
jgi:5-methylcytosine-specific restriction endonuclease McrA